jgi:hypothetical protein
MVPAISTVIATIPTVIATIPTVARTPDVTAAMLRERGRAQRQCDDTAADDEG